MLLLLLAGVLPVFASGQPVRSDRPRVLMTPGLQAELVAKRQANDPTWTALKQKADAYATYPVVQYKYATRHNWYSHAIFYAFQGSEWYEAAMTLGTAWIASSDTAYAAKLLEMADEMIRAETDPDNMAPAGKSPFQANNSYPSRYMGAVAALIYDWCYDLLGEPRRAALAGLMDTYFGYLRVTGDYSAYQNNGPATGNYFGGHMAAAAYMGYALHGDHPAAQHMIDWARIRFDGTPSPLLSSSDIPTANRVQAFEGGLRNYMGNMWGVPYGAPGTTGAPFKGGYNFQGWAYGTNEWNRMLDFMLLVETATGEDVTGTYAHWFHDMYRALRHGTLPNRYVADPTGDFGGNQGNVIALNLAARLSFLLAGTPDGPGAQHLAFTELAQNTGYGYYAQDVRVEALSPWEAFLFKDTTRPSAVPTMSPYYSAFGPAYPKAGPTNGAIPYFIMRSDWSEQAVWASIQMGAAYWDDHQHYHAGHLYVAKGEDQLLIDPSKWRGPSNGNGLVGSGMGYITQSGTKNTLFVNDYGDYQRDRPDRSGGQATRGFDRVVAAEMTDDYSYVRSDLSTAYNNMEWPMTPADTVNRSLRHFYRTFAYVRDVDAFVVFDQVKVRSSANPLGPYDKHLRWHFPEQPVVNGNRVTMTHGASRIDVHTLLPAAPSITPVSLVANPDNKWGASWNFAYNANAWRVEVRDPANPLELPFLTVLHAADAAAPAMTTTQVATADGKMIGARIDAAGATRFVFANAGPGQTPAPVTATTYALEGPAEAFHLLLGMTPGAAYAVTVDSGMVVVAQDPAGSVVASAAGALRFAPAGVTGAAASENVAAKAAAFATAAQGQEVPGQVALDQNYPNPFNPTTALRFSLPEAGTVRLAVYDVLGREVRVLADGPYAAGAHAVTFDAAGLASGTYLYRLATPAGTLTRRMVLMQ